MAVEFNVLLAKNEVPSPDSPPPARGQPWCPARRGATDPIQEESMPLVTMNVNGRPATGNVENRTLLVEFLRDHLGLTGTHVGCDTSQCGACVVHIDGTAMKSCTAFAVGCQGMNITTIEGLAKNGQLHPMQEAFRENHGLQCGFCTPGFIMSSDDIVKRYGKKL